MYIRSGGAYLVTIIREDKVAQYLSLDSSSSDLKKSAEKVNTVNVYNGSVDLEIIL